MQKTRAFPRREDIKNSLSLSGRDRLKHFSGKEKKKKNKKAERLRSGKFGGEKSFAEQLLLWLVLRLSELQKNERRAE